MLNRKTPETLAAKIKLEGQGVTSVEDVVFHNRTQAQIDAFNAHMAEDERAKSDPLWADREMFLFLVKSVNGHTPTHQDVETLQTDFPGAGTAFIIGFYNERQLNIAKN